MGFCKVLEVLFLGLVNLADIILCQHDGELVGSCASNVKLAKRPILDQLRLLCLPKKKNMREKRDFLAFYHIRDIHNDTLTKGNGAYKGAVNSGMIREDAIDLMNHTDPRKQLLLADFFRF